MGTSGGDRPLQDTAIVILEEEDKLPTPSGYIIAITQGGRFRRLHMAGGCKRYPGEHYHDWRDLGSRAPLPHEFNARCLHCFPEDKIDLKELAEADVSDVGSMSSTDSEVAAAEERSENEGP